MKVSRDTRARLAALVAQGVLSADVMRSTLSAMIEPEETGICIACSAEALLRDYICGSCSLLKVKDERKFWQRVESGPTDIPSRNKRPYAGPSTGRTAGSIEPVVIDQVEVRRMVDSLEMDLTLLSWREAFLRSIPEDKREMYERERLSVESQRALTGRLLSFWTFKLEEKTIDARVDGGVFPPCAVA